MWHLKLKKEAVDQVGRQSISIIADAGNSRHSVVSLWSVSIETHFYGQVFSFSIFSGYRLLVSQKNQRNCVAVVWMRRENDRWHILPKKNKFNGIWKLNYPIRFSWQTS